MTEEKTVVSRVVGETGRYHLLIALAHHRPRGRVRQSLDGAFLDPVERALRGAAVGL